MSSTLSNTKAKDKCQVFTPDKIVSLMLDYLDYKDDLYGKSILEFTCGNGQFLKEIVKRYIMCGKKEGLSNTKIRNGLARDIFGIELDEKLYEECIDNLNSVTEMYGINKVKWNIKNADALKEPFERDFDFVVGNPPYISYWDLDREERKYIKENYSVCKGGHFDCCYAFIEEGLERLNPCGKMALIVPNSIFKTKSGQLVRNKLLSCIVTIHDYTTNTVFSEVQTSPAIIVADLKSKSKCVKYIDDSNNTKKNIDKSNLNGEWVFSTSKTIRKKGEKTFGDYFNVATPVATQLNSVFIIREINKDGTINDDFRSIEKDVLRKAYSPKNLRNNTKEYIIFPYYYEEGNLKKYSEESFKNRFPNTYSYLEKHKNALENRDSDKSAKWFEYGRSQALQHLNQEKLLMSTVVTNRIYVYDLNTDDVPYTGLYITLKKGAKASLKQAKSILESAEFLEYLKPRAINANGKSLRIVARYIKEFELQKGVME